MLSNMSGARSRKGCDGMSKAVLVMDMPERCADCPLRSSEKTSYVCCYLTLKNISSTDYYDKSQIGVRSGNCRRKQIIPLIVIMGDLIKAGMPAWT